VTRLRSLILGLAAAGALAQATPALAADGDWPKVAPQAAGMDPAGVQAALDYAGSHNSTGVVIVRGGKLVAEQYWQGWDQAKADNIYSASKSVTSTLVALAIQDGFIKSVDQSAADFVPGWKGTPKAAITIRHLLTMTSGLKVAPAGGPKPGDDLFATTAALPQEHAPGTYWVYNTPAYRMLVRIVEIAVHEPAQQYMERRLTGPLGMTHTRWQTSPAPDGSNNYYWLEASTRDMARFGLFAAHKGRWNGKQIVPAAWIAEATRPSQELNRSYGYLWWLNGQPSYMLPALRPTVLQGELWPECPADMFAALGAMDKKIYVVPSLDLVVVRHGGAAERGGGGGMHGGLDKEFMGRLCQAVKP
jgi:CubicO group peptidase (beta-lactamase class C family)